MRRFGFVTLKRGSGRRGRRLEGAGGTPSRAARGRSGLRSGQRRDVGPTKYLVSSPRRWAGRRLLRHRADLRSVRLALHAKHPARAPAGVDAESRGVADGHRRRRRFGDPLLDIRVRPELCGLMERLGRGEAPKAGGDRYEQGPEVAELGADLPAETKSAEP